VGSGSSLESLLTLISLVRTALAKAERLRSRAKRLTSGAGAGGSNPLAPTIYREAVPPGAAFVFSASGPRPVLSVLLSAVLPVPFLLPYMVPVRGTGSEARPVRLARAHPGRR
jgi:hypothetical protein